MNKTEIKIRYCDLDSSNIKLNKIYNKVILFCDCGNNCIKRQENNYNLLTKCVDSISMSINGNNITNTTMNELYNLSK
jgi:hypothetical protein